MKIKALVTAFIFLFTAIALSIPDSADAARMGGGRSFGSRPSMSRPAQQPAQRSATAGQTQAPGRNGMMGGMGGLFGGLLAGTLLGSMLSGSGLGGGGGGFLDLILLGVLVFVGYKLFQ